MDGGNQSPECITQAFGICKSPRPQRNSETKAASQTFKLEVVHHTSPKVLPMGRKSRYEEIIIRISPLYARLAEALPQTTPAPKAEPDNFFDRLAAWAKRPARDPNDAQTYDVFVYTNLSLKGLDTADDCQEEISGLKLAGCGQIVVHWEQYRTTCAPSSWEKELPINDSGDSPIKKASRSGTL